MSMTLTCRICGCPYTLGDGAELQACPACGTVNVRPQSEGETLDRFRRATQQRLSGQFQDAEKSYQYVLVDCPDEYEALWGLALCRYGVEFVEDHHRRQRVPVVHIPRTRPLSVDGDFIRACELAPEEIARQYEADAEYVDRALARIRELNAGTPGYDIFLCHKTTTLSGEGYTEDYRQATQLYLKLKEKGYRVFFAPLSDLQAGANYEAGIYHALRSARVMLLFCSSREFLESPWVRSEWQRYLEMIDEEAQENRFDKHLVPLMFDHFPDRRLPREIFARHLQHIDMGEITSMEKLMDAVAQHAGVPAPAFPAQMGYPGAQPQYPGAFQQGYQDQPVLRSDMPPMTGVQDEFAPVVESALTPSPEEYFEVGESSSGKWRIRKYVGPGDIDVIVPTYIRGRKVQEFGPNCFGKSTDEIRLGMIFWPEGISNFFAGSFWGARPTRFVVAAANTTYRSENGVVFRRDNGQLSCYPSGSSRREYAVPEGTPHIYENAFRGCINLERVTIPSSVEKIDDLVFRRCHRLQSVILSEGLRTLGDECFEDCDALTQVQLPASLVQLGDHVFSMCVRLSEIRVAEGNASYYVRDGVLFDRNGTLMCYPARLENTAYAIPEGVRKIGASAFSCAGALTEIRIPESVTEIDDYAFDGCVGLTQLTLPAGLRRIGISSFAKCEKFRRIVINEGVQSVGKWAFDGCSLLEEVSFPSTVQEMGERMFISCPHLMRLTVAEGNPRYYVSDGVMYSRDGALRSCPAGLGLTRYAVRPGTKEISESAFTGCDTLQQLELPQGLTSICEFAFNRCSGLSVVDIPDSVTAIADTAFNRCGEVTLRGCAGSPAQTLAEKKSKLSFEERRAPAQPCTPEDEFSTRPVAGGCEVTGCTEDKTEIVVPPVIRGLQVVSIGKRAFNSQYALRRVILPEGVSTLGDYVFSYCIALEEVVLPESLVSMGEHVFENCLRLGHVRVPAGVNHLDPNSLLIHQGCLRPEIDPANPYYYIQDDVLFHRDGTLVRLLPQEGRTVYRVPEGVKALGDDAFDDTMLEEIILPSSLVQIGYCALHTQKLRRLTIPASVTTIASGALSGKERLEELTVAPGNQNFYVQDGMLLSRDGVLLYCMPEVTKGVLTLPQTVREVGAWVCFTRTELTRVVTGDSLRVIGSKAFNSCYGLESVVLCEGLETIRYIAFGGCRKLAELTIPASVTQMAAVCSDNTVMRVYRDSYAHQYAVQNNLKHQAVEPLSPAEREYGTERMADGCVITSYTGLGGDVEIPQSIGGLPVIGIGTRAFRENAALRSVKLPQTVRVIEEWAFSKCAALRRIEFPEGLTTIGRWSFNGCTALQSVRLPASLHTVSDHAFIECASLTEVTLEEGVQTLEEGAFKHCSTLAAIRLPDSLVTIGPNAFELCTALREVTFGKGLRTIGQFAFSECTALWSVEIPAGVGVVGEWTFCKCTTLGVVNIQPGITAIGRGAFYGCTNMTRLEIPASVTEIGDRALYACFRTTMFVQENSFAHRFAAENDYPFKLMQAGNAPARPGHSARTDAAQDAPALLNIRRSPRPAQARRKIAVRIDGQHEFFVGNGETLSLRLAPGRHVFELQFKPLLGAVKWDSRPTAQNIFPTLLQSGSAYNVDLAQWLDRFNT